MLRSLSNTALETYRKDGYYFPVPVLSSNEVAHARKCLEGHEAKTGEPLQGNFRHKAHLLFTWVDALVHHPPDRPSPPPRAQGDVPDLPPFRGVAANAGGLAAEFPSVDGNAHVRPPSGAGTRRTARRRPCPS